MEIFLDEDTIGSIKKLQDQSVEYNGQIVVDNGTVSSISYRQGQTMEPCLTGCTLNFHTHPPDYDNLYPDHPSLTDYVYIYTATCSLKELSAHLIFTPKFIYIIYYNCQHFFQGIYDRISITHRLEEIFGELSSSNDRSTEEFRIKWMNACQNLGFHVSRFKYTDKVVFFVPPRPFVFPTYYYIIFLCALLYCVYLTKKNLSSF